MTRTFVAALAAFAMLSACAAAPDSYVAGRADNNMLRFSASNYALPDPGPR